MKGITGNPTLAYQRFAVQPVSGAQQSQGTQVKPTTTQATEAAKVTISAQAREIAGSSTVNTQKVEALKTSIADGSFKVDPNVVAQRMLEGLGI